MNKAKTGVLIFFVVLFNIVACTNSENNDEPKTNNLSFYEMDYNSWRKTYASKLEQGDSIYEDWFFKNAKKVSVSKELYDSVILHHPTIAGGIFEMIIDEDGHDFKDRGGDSLIYFPFNGNILLFGLENSPAWQKKYETKQFDGFKKFLEDIDNEKIYCVAEYNKNSGWFNYDSFVNVLKQKKDYPYDRDTLK